MAPPTQRVLYRLDAADRIEATAGDWARFARENGAPELAAGDVLRRPLWDFVAGDEVRQLLGLLFDRVRATGAELRVPFRCDAPAERRFLELHVRPLAAGALEIETRVLRTEPRAYIPLLERSSRLRYGRVSICSWCLRIRLASGEWVEVEEAVTAMDLLGSMDLPILSHGICQPCAARAFGAVHLPETG